MLFLLTAELFCGDIRILQAEGRSAGHADLWAGFDRSFGRLACGLHDDDCYGYVYVGY